MPPMLKPLGGVLIFLGMILLYSTTRKFRQARSSLDWPSVEGEIISSQVDADDIVSEPMNFWPKVMYRYAVDNITYTSDKISNRRETFIYEGAAPKVADRYPTGKLVKVFYDPNHPQLAVLEPGPSKPQSFQLGLSVFGIATGIIFLII